MKKILFLAICLFSTFPVQAQFAPQIIPDYDYDENASNNSPQPAVFQNPVKDPPAPKAPTLPPSIKKPKPYSGNIRVLATVNGEIITTEDINNRVRAFCMTTGIPYNSQTKVLIINKVMQNTIDEKLKLQDAINNKIDITPQELDGAISSFVKSNKSTLSNLKHDLAEFGVNEKVFREQMKSDLAWLRLIRNKAANDTVTEIEIQEALQATKADMNKKKYMVSEIVIDRKEARDINDLSRTLRQDPRFEMYAAQFSQSPSSASGGRLGWVNEGQLPQPLDSALRKMSSGQVSDPILYNDSYYILKVEKKFDPAKDKLPEPTEKEISEMLQGQKTERLAARHLQYLRQRASIELKE
ncbi:MAG: peptidylprolyl isomerase [Alphaproteobacteria bacterium]|nr:peptidylprolyl isomerase [Alphaproteobacteria bacterium]